MPRVGFVVVCLLLMPMVHAQWAWIDGRGQRVYSDRPPPPEVPERNVLKQPNSPISTSVDSSPKPATSATATQTNAAPAGRDASLESRKREQEQAEAAKRKADEARLKAEQARATAARTDNCARARQSLAVVQSGQRMRIPLPNGELGFMDDEQRAAEVQRLQQLLASECSP